MKMRSVYVSRRSTVFAEDVSVARILQ